MALGGPARHRVEFQCVNKFHLSRSVIFSFIAILILRTSAQGFCEKNEENCQDSPVEDENIDESDPNLDTYQNYFDENGKFKANLFNQDLPKDEYEIVEESSQNEEDNPENIKYDHMRTPNFTIVLNSAYEDNLEGVHLMNKYQQKFAMDEFVSGKMAAGEMGNGIVLQDMIHEEKLRMDLIYYDHAFNQYVSDLIPTNRSLPDRRDDWCKKPSSFYTTSDKLPPTSVIICFHNEAWSTLLRTLYSVINRSPAHLLQEIILVDDASTADYLQENLDSLVAQTPKLRLVRLETRQGLVRTRMAGIRAATAEVLTFLDSHIEATDGWLEPLLDRIARNYRTVASPVIETIDEKTFQYKFVTADLMGTFNWKLEFDWTQISEEQLAAREHKWAPYNSPTMAGGLFSISKFWFEKIGLYDEGMEIWGGENLEMSFRQWMCGGTIEIVPCSRVGHVFRAWSPYPWRTDINVLTYNPIRVAMVWMDDFKYLYFDRFARWDKPQLRNRIGKWGDVSERILVREALECNSFQWYLDNVAVEVPQHSLFASGEIFNQASRQCLDKEDKPEMLGQEVKTSECEMTGGNQYWLYRTDGKILRDYLCITASQEDKLVLSPCEETSQWVYQDNLLIWAASQTCLSLQPGGTGVSLAQCSQEDSLQHWHFTHYNPAGLPYRDLA